MAKKNVSQQVQKSEEELTKLAFGKAGADERSKLLQTRQPIEGTPFTKGWIEGHGWAIGLDNKRLTEWVETEEEIDNKIKGGLTLKEITTLIYTLILDVEEQKEFTKNNN